MHIYYISFIIHVYHDKKVLIPFQSDKSETALVKNWFNKNLCDNSLTTLHKEIKALYMWMCGYVCVSVPGIHHSGRLRGHQRTQRAPVVPDWCSPQLHLLWAHLNLLPLLGPPTAQEEKHAVGTAAEQEGRSELQRGQGGCGQRCREDQPAETDPVQALREAGTQRPGANEDETFGPFSHWIQ